MAHFCVKTGVRIAGPGIADTYEPSEADLQDPAFKTYERHVEVVELDGEEVPKDRTRTKPKATKPSPEPAPGSATASTPESPKGDGKNK